MYRTTQNELCRQTLEQKNPGLQSIKIAHEKKKQTLIWIRVLSARMEKSNVGLI